MNDYLLGFRCAALRLKLWGTRGISKGITYSLRLSQLEKWDDYERGYIDGLCSSVGA